MISCWALVRYSRADKEAAMTNAIYAASRAKSSLFITINFQIMLHSTYEQLNKSFEHTLFSIDAKNC